MSRSMQAGPFARSLTWSLVCIAALSFSLSLITAHSAEAASNTKRTKKSKRSSLSLPEFTWTLDGLTGINGQQPRTDSIFNPGNQILQLSTTSGFIEARLNAELSFEKKLKFVARPRLLGTLRTEPEIIPEPAVPPKTALVDVYLNEGFAQVEFTDTIQFAIGRQNFQWGPAELVSPTNIFFPEVLAHPEPYYETRGRTMARLNVSPNGWLSWITMAELVPLKDYEFQTRLNHEDTQKRWLTKLEASWNSGADYIGLVGGSRTATVTNGLEKNRYLGGAYGAWTPNDALQFYADVLIGQGSDAPYPDQTFGIGTWNADNGQPFVYGIGGVRYTFPGGTEWRLEGVVNDYGYTRSEQDLLRAGLAAPDTQAVFLSALASASQVLPGRQYLYSALRMTETDTVLGFLQQPTTALRVLFSLEDSSQLWTATLDAGLTERSTLYAFGGVANGFEDSDLRRYIDYFGGLAFKYSF